MARQSQLWFLGIPIQFKTFTAKTEAVGVVFASARNVFILDRERKTFILDKNRRNL